MDGQLKRIRQIFPYIGSVVIVISILKSYLYYKVFGLYIFHYLEFSEYLTLSLGDIIMLFASITFITLIYHKEFDGDPRILTMKEFKKSWLFYSFLCLLPWFYYLLIKSDKQTLLFCLAYTSFVILMCLGLLIASRYAVNNEKDKKFHFAFFVVIFSSYTIFLSFYAAYSAKLVKSSRRNVHISMKNGITLNTSDSLVYIGMTKNYIIFYKPFTEEKLVKSRDEITDYLIK